MACSMTAFSRSSDQTPWGEVTCELRSVNHRYLEIIPRLCDEVRSLEPHVREIIARHLKRGRVDCTIRLQQEDVWTEDIAVNAAVISKLVHISEQIRSQSVDLQPLRVVDLLKWPGVVQAERLDEDQIGTVAINCLKNSIGQLLDIRKREGDRLLQFLEHRLQEAQKIVDELKKSLPVWQQLFRQRIEKRLAEARVELDPTRVEQELVVYIQKADVSEEIERLTVHMDEVSNVLKQNQSIGRRLDFLMQELNREANTLGAKSMDSRLSQASVELKVLIEQMREQVQNLE